MRPVLVISRRLQEPPRRSRPRPTLHAIGYGVATTTLSVLLLSAAGIYAMMSFTVARRRREIGICAALGASTGRLLGSVVARGRAGRRGCAVRRAPRGGRQPGRGGDLLTGERLLLLPLAAGLMAVIGLLAALGPARRGLAVQPSEALREE